MTERRRELLWTCLQCGIIDQVTSEYCHGDHEPCYFCENGTAHVVGLREAAAWSLAMALGARSERNCAPRLRTLRGHEYITDGDLHYRVDERNRLLVMKWLRP